MCLPSMLMKAAAEGGAGHEFRNIYYPIAAGNIVHALQLVALARRGFTPWLKVHSLCLSLKKKQFDRCKLQA